MSDKSKEQIVDQEYNTQEEIISGNSDRFRMQWSSGGGILVYRHWDMYFAFAVPMYGGEPDFIESFHISKLNELVELANSWT